MLNRFTFLLLWGIPLLANAQELPLIPYPEKVQIIPQTHSFGSVLTIDFGSAISPEKAAAFGQLCEQLMAVRVQGGKLPQADARLVIDAALPAGTYRILPEGTKLAIVAADETAAWNGLMTLMQLIDYKSKSLRLANITDAPRYTWRGVMLDESRHFFGETEVKKLLDMMAYYKLNKFHWHLTDEPGWRIEIKQYPKLTTVGGKGNFSNPDAPAAFYTQEQIREIVQYAADRNIEIIPEIDMPGHATAAVRAYPEIGGGGSEKHPDFTFNPAKKETYAFLTNVLREISELFPGNYLHIGGDEVSFGNKQWADMPEVKKLMQQEKLGNLLEVEHYFIRRMADSVQAMGKQTLGWDEVTDAGLQPAETVVMWWRHDHQELLKRNLERGYRVILCPRIPLYFDFVQDAAHQVGRRWSGAYAPNNLVYAFPNEALTGISDLDQPQILGIQANVWTEQMQTPERLEFMLFPRLAALAEAGWTKNKSWDSFKKRIPTSFDLYNRLTIRYFNFLDPSKTPEIVK